MVEMKEMFSNYGHVNEWLCNFYCFVAGDKLVYLLDRRQVISFSVPNKIQFIFPRNTPF